jgi:RND superfamily putative drug exporter
VPGFRRRRLVLAGWVAALLTILAVLVVMAAAVAAIAIDATIVRMVLVPAVVQILGDRSWWLPR